MKLSTHQKKAVLDFIMKSDDSLFEDCNGLYEEGTEFDASLEGSVEEFIDGCRDVLDDLIERGKI